MLPARSRLRIRSIPRAIAATAVGVVMVCGGVAAASGGGRPDLPPITAVSLMASVARAAERSPAISGLVEAHVDLGLPSIPQQGPQPTGVGALLQELTGDHRVRVWSSKDGYRADDMLPTAERAVYVGASGGWLWSSDSFTAYRLFGPNDARRAARLGEALRAERAGLMHMSDPLTLARTALSGLTPTTAVGVGEPVRVAGRPAYVLVLTPKDQGTLVGHVDVAVDAATRVPLAVRVYARAARSPAVSVGFAAVRFGPIPPSTYRFEPPRGARVVQPHGVAQRGGVPGTFSGRDANGLGLRVFGSSWSSIVAVRIDRSRIPSGSVDGLDLVGLLPYSGPLFSVRLANVGAHAWLLAGAVPQSALAAVESRLP